MRLRVLASGSSANGYVLYNDKEALVIECGVSYSQCLRAIDFRRDKIVGAILSHGHGDHAKYVEQYLEAGINVYASRGTAEESMQYVKKKVMSMTPVRQQELFTVGGFSVNSFDTQHDSAEPTGFLIHHKETGIVLFATDTYYLRYKFANLSHVMLECNYDEEIINRNVKEKIVPEFVKQRVQHSHMSLETHIDTLKANDLSSVNTVVLLHLSAHNSNPELFKKRVEEETGKLVYVAEKGLDIPFNKNMF